MGSARVESGTDKRGGLRARPGRRPRDEPGGRTLGLSPPGEKRGRRCTRRRGREEAPLDRRGRPAVEGDPGLLRGCPHKRHRAHAGAHRRLRRPEKGPKGKRESDCGRGVQPPRQELPRHDDHARAAALAFVAPSAHRRQLRGATRSERAPNLPLPRPIAVNHQPAAVRPTRDAAPHAPRGAHLRRRRHLLAPRLDVERTSVNLLRAPSLQTFRSTTRRCPSKDRLRVTLLWACTMPMSPPPRRGLRRIRADDTHHPERCGSWRCAILRITQCARISARRDQPRRALTRNTTSRYERARASPGDGDHRPAVAPGSLFCSVRRRCSARGLSI